MLRQCSWFLVVTMFVQGFSRTVLSFRLAMAETVELELALPLVVMVTGANAGGWDAVAMTLVIVPCCITGLI